MSDNNTVAELEIIEEVNEIKRAKRKKQKKVKDTGEKKYFKRSYSFLAQGLLCLLFMPYLEIVFHIGNFKEIGEHIILPILFTLPIGALIFLLTGLFSTKVNKILLWVLIPLMTFPYMVETIYEFIFKTPLVMTDIGTGNLQAAAYWRETLAAILGSVPTLLFMTVPMIVYAILLKKGMETYKKRYLYDAVVVVWTIIFFVVSIMPIKMSDRVKSNIYENYYDMYDAKVAIKNYGVFTTLRLSFMQVISSSNKEIDLDSIEIDGPVDMDKFMEESSSTVTENNGDVDADGDGEIDDVIVIDTTPNMLNIDFVKLAESESDAKRKKLNEYFASLYPTRKNEYTGMFEGYNLIYITAEAFSPYCVDEQLTPTLYKLVNTGFVFENFYVPPTGESTAGGEHMNVTGLLTNPNRPSGVYTIQQTMDNYMPYGLGNVFGRMGVTSYAYHNNSLSYYNRIGTLPNLGYIFKAAKAGAVDEKEAIDKGLIFEIDSANRWPQSDLDMMNVTLKEYLKTDGQFHAYYMTVSGHALYTKSGNAQAAKNWHYVENLPYSEEAKGYIACNIELDRALESLIKQLEEAGVLDKTVICMSADHEPYGLQTVTKEELAGHDLDETIGIYKNNLILWNSAMEPVKVEKACTSIDILPTLLNLFGIEYDSRLLMGKDILSTDEGFVIFPGNRSIIFGDVIYNSNTRVTTDLDGNEVSVSSEKLDSMKEKMKLMLAMNQILIDSDYYSSIKEYIE